MCQRLLRNECVLNRRLNYVVVHHYESKTQLQECHSKVNSHLTLSSC